jgi:hypothetical protein
VTKLDQATQFTERSAMTAREARSFKAAIDAGKTCARCSQRATAVIAGEFLCRLDAQVVKQRRERDRMRRRA